jgi:electron transfer flavoprotein alpha subunit
LALQRDLLHQARALAASLGWSVAALAFGQPADLGPDGADVIYTVATDSTASPERYVTALAEVVAQTQPALLLVGATKLGLEVAPRVAERAKVAYVPWATAVAVDASTCVATVTSLHYTGTARATYRCQPGLAIVAAVAGALGTAPASAGAGQIVSLNVDFSAPRVTIVSQQPKTTYGASLEEAHAVIDVGQGVKQRGDLDLVRQVAELLGGQLACSRPVAADRDWFPDWLGLSGQKVAPELCLTIGVSGAIQHIIGIRDARLIAAVNIDENAAIFAQADVGVVADLYAFLPALAARLQARGVHPVWANYPVVRSIPATMRRALKGRSP